MGGFHIHPIIASIKAKSFSKEVISMKNCLVLIFILTVFLLSSCDKIIIDENWNPEENTPVLETQIEETEAEEVQKEVEEVEKIPENISPKEEVNVETDVVLDRTKTGFGYSPNSKNEQVSIGKKYEDLMTKYNAFFIDRSNTKNIYLTMDEGYENGYTEMILDTLKEKGVQCAFFVTMPYVEKNPQLVERMINEGHILGNHSVNHKSMPTLSDEEAKAEIKELHDYILTKYGYTMRYFRPPMGEYSESSLNTANELGYRSVFWSFAYRDWETDNFKGKDYAISSVNKGIHNGCVLLLHAVSKDNAEGLPEIIDSLREKGYIFSTLDNIK